MADRRRALKVALRLTRRALVLLDALGETVPAIHLQRAVDLLEGRQAARPEAEAEAMRETAEVRQLEQQFVRTSGDKAPASVEAADARAVAKSFGDHLVYRRTAVGLTQGQLAGRSDLSVAYLSLVECGRANPTIGTMVKLADALELEVADLLLLPA